MNMHEVWNRITAHAGESFHTKTGLPFSYHISGQWVVLENTNRSIPFRDFEAALALSDLRITNLQKLNLQGPSYLYGILTDPRIAGSQSSQALAAMFTQELKTKVQRAKAECNYSPTAFSHMLEQYGGVETVKRLIANSLRTGRLSDGYAKLFMLGRLDLTAEDSVCKPQYAPLFTPEEIAYCKDLLGR